MTAAARVLEIFDTEPDIVAGRPAASACRVATCASSTSTSPSPTPPTSRCCATSTSTWRRARRSPSSAPPAPARPRSPRSSRGSTTSPAAASRSTVSTCATSTLVALRSLVATAFEEPTLFSMSARENVTLGRSDAAEDDVLAALEIAQAGFVHDLPVGSRHPDRRAGHVALRRTAPAARARPGRAGTTGRPRARRHAVGPRRAHREARRGGPVDVLSETTGLVVAHRASTVLLADRVALLEHGTITHVGDPPRPARARAGLPRPARRRRCRPSRWCQTPPMPTPTADPADPARRPPRRSAHELHHAAVARRRRRRHRGGDLTAETSARLAGRSRTAAAGGAASLAAGALVAHGRGRSWRTPLGCPSRTSSRRASTPASRRSGSPATSGRCCSSSASCLPRP